MLLTTSNMTAAAHGTQPKVHSLSSNPNPNPNPNSNSNPNPNPNPNPNLNPNPNPKGPGKGPEPHQARRDLGAISAQSRREITVGFVGDSRAVLGRIYP